jgi:trigger factor
MKVSVKDSGTCRKTMTVEVPADGVAEERAELLKYYTKNVALPGFRKGKAPKHLVEKKFEKEMNADLKDRLLPKYYHEAIEAEKLQVVSIVNVSEPNLDDKGLNFEVTLDVPPEFKLPKYQGISIKSESTDVEDKQVEETIENIRRQHASFEDIEGRPAKEKDMVQVSYESTIDGEPLETKVPEARGMGQGSGYWITCDDESFLPGMGKKLIGTSIGDKKDITVKFPKEFIVKELSGMTAEFKVEVTAMRETKLPEFDEEFLKKLQVESEDELRKNVRKNLEETAEAKEKRRREDAVCEYLIKKTKMDVPESAVQQQTRNVMYEMARMRMMQGMSQEQVQAQTPDMMEEAKTKAEEQVKLRYIMLAIAEAEELKADEQEMAEEIASIAVQQRKDVDEVRKEFEKEDRMGDVADQIRFGKAIELLIENAKIK